MTWTVGEHEEHQTGFEPVPSTRLESELREIDTQRYQLINAQETAG